MQALLARARNTLAPFIARAIARHQQEDQNRKGLARREESFRTIKSTSGGVFAYAGNHISKEITLRSYSNPG